MESEEPSGELLGGGGSSSELTCCTPALLSSAPAQPQPGHVFVYGQEAATIKHAPEEAAGRHGGGRDRTGRT